MLVGSPQNSAPYTPPGYVNDPLSALALGGPGALSVTDSQSTAFQGAVPMTQGVAYASMRSVEVDCTAAGGITFTLADGSTRTRTVLLGTSTFPYAVTSWTLPSSTPATVSAVFNLK